MPNDTPELKPTVADALSISSRPGWYFIYGFFLIHMAAFGSAGFFMSYGEGPDLGFNFLFSGFAIVVYIVFYLTFFGVDEIWWLFINSALGILGILAQLDWILGVFGSSTANYPMQAHIIPAIYYVLYTFLLRRAVLHIFHAEDGTRKKQIIDGVYVAASLLVYVPILAF